MKTMHPIKPLLCGVTLLITGALQASIVTYDYHGTVIGVSGPSEPNFGGLVMGDSISGSLTYETTTLNNGNLSDAAYDMISMSIQVGAFSYSLPSSYIEIFLGNEYYWAAGGQTPAFSLGIELFNSAAPYVQNDTLLRPPPDVSTVDGHYGDLNFNHGNEGDNTHLNFSLDSVVLHSSSVPDTGCTLALLVFAFAALSLLRRRSVSC